MRPTHGILCVSLALSLFLPSLLQAQGIYLPVGGPVGRSMGGATTAAPLDAISSLYWNPATISALPSSQLGFGMELLLADIETESSIAGLGGGSTGAEPGVIPIPTIGWVHKTADPRVTYGLGLLAVAGFKTNFPADLGNPVLAPQSNNPAVPGGLGRIYSEAEFLQMTPTLSYAVSDRLSIGIGPTITMGKVAADPLLFAPPDDADGSGAARYPSGRGTRIHWGGGAQLGLYYIGDCGWHFGASIKSPQWMEDFRIHSENELGRPQVHKFKLDLPMILSLGTSYSGIDGIVFALDVRYFDYKNTDGFGGEGFNPDGSVRGLGWSNVFAAAAGMQYRVNEAMYMRLGYSFNQSPIQGGETMFNLGSPLYWQHLLHMGSSMRLSEALSMNMAYSYLFESEVSGPILTPLGAVPGSSVASRETAHVLSFGVSVNY